MRKTPPLAWRATGPLPFSLAGVRLLSSVMYTAMVGIKVYRSSRNFKLFSAFAGLSDAQEGEALADLLPLSGPGGSVVTEPRIKPGADLLGVTLAFG